MPVAMQSLLEQALALSLSDRATMANVLLSSLVPTDPKLDELWAKEAEARIVAVEAGDMATIPADEVFAELSGKSDKS